MSKKIILIFIPLLFVALNVNAQGFFGDAVGKAKQAREKVENRIEATTENFEAKKEARQERVEEMVQERKNRFEEIREKVNGRKAQIGEKQRERVGGLLTSVENRFKNVTSRFEMFLERIEGKITDLEDRGLNMSESKALFEDLEAQVAGLNDVIETATNEIQGELDQEEVSRDAVKEIGEEIKNEVSKIKEMLRSLIETMKSEIKLEE